LAEILKVSTSNRQVFASSFMKPGRSLELIFFFQIPGTARSLKLIFFQIPEIGGSLILSNTWNRQFFETDFPNKTGGSFILKVLKYLELAGIKIKYPPPHRYEV
jgi:hypothetical protein